MILLPKYRTIQADGIIAHMTQTMCGELRFIKYNSMGQVNYDSGWFPNRWLDQGLDNFASQGSAMFHWWSLGDSNAAIVDSQTGLQGAYLGSSQDTNGTSDAREYGGSPDYEVTISRNRRFGAGVATGTIREVVMRNLSGNPTTNANIRAIISPEVVKASDETLDVFYRWTIFPQLTDANGTATIDSLVYDTVGRIYNAAATLTVNTALAIPQIVLVTGSSSAAQGDGADLIAVDASGGWGGTSDGGTSATEFTESYTPGDHYIDWYFNVGLNGWNTGSGIRVVHHGGTMRPYQVKFTRQGGGGETVPKDNTMVVENFKWRLGWARH